MAVAIHTASAASPHCFQRRTVSNNHLLLSKMSFATNTSEAPSAAVVTPTIDDFEQATFFAATAAAAADGDDNDRYVVLQRDVRCREVVEELQPRPGPILTGLERLIDAVLPEEPMLCSPTADTAATGALENYAGHDNRAALENSVAPLAASPTQHADHGNDYVPQEHSERDESSNNDVIDAAEILCNFKYSAMEKCAPQDAAEIVDIAVGMLSDEKHGEEDGIDEEEQGQHYAEYPQANENDAFATAAVDSLLHPDRLALEDDAEEVNKLHQYVRRDLLEIFVVPQAATTDNSDDEDDDDEEGSCAKNPSSNGTNAATAGTRRLVTRRRSITVSHAPPSATAQRHYPGRVGLRCVYCSNIRRKSTSKAAFYPLRLKNIYREVCAWQRIHFKKCPHVPEGVRERYDHYKRIDTSRGKVRYWETSARRIGLVNNPDRDDGVVFAKTAFRAIG